MTVIAPLELDDLLAPRGRPRDAHGAHRGLGPRADEPHALERRHQRGGRVSPSSTSSGLGRAVARAVSSGRGKRLDETPRRVAVDERSPRHHVVDVAVAVDVFERRAGRAANEERRRADRLEGADGAVDAAGQNPLSAREETRRTIRASDCDERPVTRCVRPGLMRAAARLRARSR